MKKHLLLLTIFAFLPFIADAQLGKLFNTDKQLSSGLVNYIYQDHKGLIWIATNNGLDLYDGYQFRIFKKDNNDKNSIFSNFVNCLLQDKSGVFYIGLNNNLQIFENDRFTTVDVRDIKGKPLSCCINSICQRANGDVLIGTSGRGLLKVISKGKAKQIDMGNININFSRRLLEDKNGYLWIVTEDNGVFSIKGKDIKHYLYRDGEKNSIFDICQDNRGNIYLAHMNGGLYRLVHGQKDFSPVPSTMSMPIVSLKTSKDGNILVGTNGLGLMVYNPVLNTITPSLYYSNEINLSKGKIYTILEDNSGNIWTGLLQKGVFMQPAFHSGFGYVGYKSGDHNPIGDACVMCIKKTKDGTLWVATDNNGLYALDDKGNLKKHFVHNNGKSSVPSTILGITEDSNGKLWVGSYLEGCGWIDKNTGEYHRLDGTLGKANSVFDLVVDHNDVLWIGTMGDGLKRINLATKEIKEYRNIPDNKKCLLNDYINQIYLSSDGNRLYIGTTVGLCCLDIKTDSWTKSFGTNSVLTGNTAFAIREDNIGNLWVCTQEGLYCINRRTKHRRLYTTEQGIADNNTASVEIDRKNRIWISTSHGMSCLDQKTGRVSNYYVGDGLQGNEFSEGVSCTSTDGEMVFGGLNGVTFFNPMNLSQGNHNLKLHLTNFLVGGKNIKAGEESGGYIITDTTVISTHKFELGHQDNTFSITLSTFSYDNPERITYIYIA